MKQEHAVYLPLVLWVFFFLLSLSLDILSTLYFRAILQGLKEDGCKYCILDLFQICSTFVPVIFHCKWSQC